MSSAMRFVTAGESHGPAVVAVIEGLPAGLSVDPGFIEGQMARRREGYGRGGRMEIETERVQILSGVRLGTTLGSPITLLVENRDNKNWREVMSVDKPVGKRMPPLTTPRPGHGDLAGMLKYDTRDARDVLERASARETAARCAAGAVARRYLQELGIEVVSRVIAVGGVRAEENLDLSPETFTLADEDPLRCPDARVSQEMRSAVDRASESGDTLGGVFEVACFGVFPGLGSCSQYDRRLDGVLCGALCSIPAVKGAEVGDGFALADLQGSEAHDEIFVEPGRGLRRRSNRAGGLEAGMTNGEPLLLRAAMKPIPSLARPLSTVDMETMKQDAAFKERADVCAVPAAAVVGEAMVALVLADACLAKLGGDCMTDVLVSLDAYLNRIARFWQRDAGADS